MSSTNRGAKRNDNDNYPTPQETIESFLPYLDLSQINSFGEPCKGDGAILKHFGGLDRYEVAEIREGVDYLKTDPEHVDLIMTNPPFSSAIEFLEKSLMEAHTVVYLLRVNFMGSKIRQPFWKANPPTHIFTLADRPSFSDVCKGDKKNKIKSCKTKYQKKDKVKVCKCGCPVGSGTDSAEYAWFVWDRMGLIKTDQPFNFI